MSQEKQAVPDLTAAEMDEQIAELQRRIDAAKVATEGIIEPDVDPVSESGKPD
jgi:hypothetical protein